MIPILRKSNLAIFLLLVTITLALSSAPAFALPSISFDFSDYGRDFAGPGTGSATLTVIDSSADLNAGTIDTVDVNVTSLADPSGIILTLKETGIHTGTFTGQLEFMTGNYIFPEDRTVTITQQDTSANTNHGAVDTITETIRSDHSGANPINPTFSETGVDTGIFQGRLTFGGFSSSTQNTIFARGGDYVQVSVPGTATWILVTPNSDTSKGIILVNSNTDDQLTATYTYNSGASSTTASATEGIRYAPGGGGGGVVSPTLVLDALAGAVGGGAPPHPKFTLNDYAVANLLAPEVEKEVLNQDPFTPIGPSDYTSLPFYPVMIDGKGYLVGQHANTLQTVTEDVGKKISFKLSTISEPIVHIGLYTNLHSLSDQISDSDTYIEYDKGQPLKVVDPHGFFANVTLDSTKNGTRQSFEYQITFGKPMQKSNIMIRAWDDRKGSNDITLFDAWQAVAQNSTKTFSTDLPQSSTLIQNIPPQDTQDIQKQTIQSIDLAESIKKWGGYSSESISDSELLGKIGIDGKYIPPWFMKTTKWLQDGSITQQEFVDAIKYMYDKGLVH